MGAHLILRTEGREDTIVPLDKLPLVFGRGREVDVTLASPLVSRRHCELYESGGRLCVRDLESLNGTFVGEERVDEQPLASGDRLTVGAAIFEVVLDTEDGEPAAAGAEAETVDPEITELDESAFESFDEDGDAATEEAGAESEFPTIEARKKRPRAKAPKSKAVSASDEDEDLDDFLKHFD